MLYNQDYQVVTPIGVNQFFVDNYCRLRNEPFLKDIYNDQIFSQIAAHFCQLTYGGC